MKFAYLALGTLLAAGSHATILRFTSDTGSTLPAAAVNESPWYGDRVNATTVGLYGYGVGSEGFTPNVQVRYSGVDSTPSTWGAGYGSLPTVLWGSSSSSSSAVNRTTITFTADPGVDVRILGFKAGDWSGSLTGITRNLWITNGSTTIWSYAGSLSDTAFNEFDLSSLNVSGSTLTLNFDHGWHTGISDVIFAQSVVPEPASMIALGLGAIALIRKRRK